MVFAIFALTMAFGGIAASAAVVYASALNLASAIESGV